MCKMISKSINKKHWLGVLGILSIYFTIWNLILTKQTGDDSESKIGLVSLNYSFVTQSNLQANFQLSDEKYVYTFYVRNGKINNDNRSTKLNVQKNAVNVQTSAKTVTTNVNQLDDNAYYDGMDHLVLISDDPVCYSLGKDKIVNFIQKIKAHIISNVGVVVNTCINTVDSQRHYAKLIIIQQSHIEIFYTFSSQNLDFEKVMTWIEDVYKPYRISNTTQQHLNTKFQSIRFEHGNERMIKNVELEKNAINVIILHKYCLVVAYSLYGSDTRYTDGAIENAKLIKNIYPSWKMWIYHDDTVPKTILTSVCKQAHVTCINMTGTKRKNKMSWRFLVASVPFVFRYIIRDIDSRISVRERAAVDEWVQSGERFHVMRDHPSHSLYPINGGMWGGTREAIPNIKDLLESHLTADYYLLDMYFLRDVVWPVARTSIFQHDSFSCDKFRGGHPFPTLRIGLEHVGSVFINGKMRKSDTRILKKATAPANCLPSLKRDVNI